MTTLTSFSYMTKKQKTTLRRLYKEQIKYDFGNGFDSMIDTLQVGKTFTFLTKNNIRAFALTDCDYNIEISYHTEGEKDKICYINLGGKIIDK